MASAYYLNQLAQKAKKSDSARFRLIYEIWWFEEHGYHVFRDKKLQLLVVKKKE